MKVILPVFIIIYCLSLPLSFCAEGKNGQKLERQNAIDQAFFMASANQDRVLRIGLVDCVLYALKKNSDILIKKIDPKLKEDDVKIKKADFEPTLTAEYNVRDNTVLAGSLLQGADVFNSNDRNFNAGVSGKLITGTRYSLDFLNERYKSDSAFQIFNPYYDLEPVVTIVQPLFRGAGIQVNIADITIARNNKLQSEKSFQDTAMSVITNAKNAYYKYILFLDAYATEKLALGRTEDLLKIDKERYSKGLISSIGLLETEAALSQRQRVLLAAESELKTAEDNLKFITNLVDDPEVWNSRIELIDQVIFKPEIVNLAFALSEAFKFRPDYQSAKIDLDNRDIRIKVAKNALFPTVDLTGSFGLNGLGKDYESALQKANINYPDLSAGVKISIPWGSADRAQYDQRKLEKAQALLAFKQLEQSIILDVRDKARNVNIQAQQVEVARVYREKETQNYNAQKERYLAGQVSTHDILDYQDTLSRAELGYITALMNYNIALVELDKSQGLTLAKNNIKLEE